LPKTPVRSVDAWSRRCANVQILRSFDDNAEDTFGLMSSGRACFDAAGASLELREQRSW
jgi:hypothetical protein